MTDASVCRLEAEMMTIQADMRAEIAALRADVIEIKRLLTSINAPVEARQWAVLLLHEYATGTDQDGNGLVYAHNFLFNQVLEYLPPSLKGLQNEYDRDWKGKKLTIIEYIQSIPDETLKDQIIAWMELARERNGK